MKKRAGKPLEQEVLFTSDAVGSAWDTHGIFSEHFLTNRIRSSPYWPSNERAETLYKRYSELWRKRYIGLGAGNEETTRREFLEYILDQLGFSYFSNLSLPTSERTQTPDYLLFQDGEAKDRVFNEDLKTKYQNAIGLLEAKKVNHPLDKVSQSDTPGRFPHQQIRDYLNGASDNEGNPFFRWGILTNGNKWRLYCRDSHPSHYFEFHLAGPDQGFCKLEDFKLFLALFQPTVFILKDGKCALDEIREQAIVFQSKLEEDLRERIFKVIADLANGFWNFKDNKITEEELPSLYDNCLIFLYRLLFILYAEGRGLLPVKPSGVGSNKYYRERFSLQRFNPRLKRPLEFQSNELTDLYEDLAKLFHLINGDKPALNKECNVPRYNGGLFNPKNHPKLEVWKVGEKALAQVLRDLMFTSGHKERSKQPGFDFGTIDYADLEVRQLGDIYEGLLGGHLEVVNGVLEPRNERGALQVSGTYYTPDWVVRFLVEKTLKPLVDEISKSSDVQTGKKDNTFANRLLDLNILDNAMGSGHFLVRATEWLADQIVYHPTTKFQIETVPLGISQEQAEISYWRRRVVEACIYGVDFNPLAVELTKLSLWLTCIAVNEPLNFLDHHLRRGNSLIGARVLELTALPIHQEQQQIGLAFGTSLTDAIAGAIKEIEVIEQEESSEIDIVKKKEERWRDKILKRLQPFQNIADLWTSASTGLELNESEYVALASGFIKPTSGKSVEGKKFEELWGKYKTKVEQINASVHPFHWELEFPDVFYEETGKRRENPGFDAILGNPPYISTQTSSEFDYRPALTYRFGFVDDLYVHFTFQGFNLLRTGGMFGYIVSDTFFTLSTKLLMRELLQSKRLYYLGQCDPFDATVDASIFVAENTSTSANYSLDFIQARYATEHSAPEKELPELATSSPKLINGVEKIDKGKEQSPIFHGSQGCLRLHRVGINAYRNAAKKVFFEPKEVNIRLYNRYNPHIQSLIENWWEKIESSSKFTENRTAILQYQTKLRPDDITLVGLIADGGQGMRTANNGRFLGYLEGSDQAKEILTRRKELIILWNSKSELKITFCSELEKANNNFDAVVEPLKSKFDPLRTLKLKRGEIYRVVKPEWIANKNDFKEAFSYRKKELEGIWEKHPSLKNEFADLKVTYPDNFISVFKSIYAFVRKEKIPLQESGIRSGEYYSDEKDAPRIAVIYSGFVGKRTWTKFRKGDPEGNKWTDIEPIYIDWKKDNVDFLFRNSGKSEPNMPVIRNAHLYFTEGVTYTLLGNHVALKAKLQPICVFDAGASRLTPIIDSVSAYTFLSVLNSNIFSYIIRKFIKHTAAYEINDIRMAPFVIPSVEQASYLDTLGNRAVEAKELVLKKLDPSTDLITFSRELVRKQQSAPKYLQPRPQLLLLDSSEECLDAIELAVQWEVEKLYGVEGMGPFDEF